MNWIQADEYGFVGNALVISLLYAFDTLVAKQGVRKARWFKVHAFANLLVCCTCITSLATVVVDPVDVSLARSQSSNPTRKRT